MPDNEEENMSEKYYAVKVGKTPGIYRTWAECAQMVQGYPGASYKRFQSMEEAEHFLENGASEPVQNAVPQYGAGEKPYAFVDGSYNAATGVYGYGGFLVDGKGTRHVIQGSGSDAEMAAMHNVAGEVLGSMAAVRLATELGLTELTIYYDYLGIEMWATGGWKRNKSGTIAYYDYMQAVRGKLHVDFVKVKGHSGVSGNEEADRLAKEAAGIL